jgi:hypothetical protein
MASTSATRSLGFLSRQALVRHRLVQYFRVFLVLGNGVPQYEQVPIRTLHTRQTVDQRSRGANGKTAWMTAGFTRCAGKTLMNAL